MKTKTLLWLVMVSAFNVGAQPNSSTNTQADTVIMNSIDSILNNPYALFFEEAYQQNPEIPRGILEAISYTITRFTHVTYQPGDAESCMGIPKIYGVMGLMRDGGGVYRNNLTTISQLSGYSEKEILESPEINILAYAKAFSAIQKQLQIKADKVENQLPVLIALSELPDKDLPHNFPMNSFLYSVLSFLNQKNNQLQYGFPAYDIDLVNVLGMEQYAVLSAPFVKIEIPDSNQEKNNKDLLTTDYPPAIWNPAASCNFEAGRSQAISAVVIHDMEGYYAGSIAWFQTCPCPSGCSNCSGYRPCGVGASSAHYLIRSSDGQVTQMVLEADKAYHVGSENAYTIGIEHEGICGTNTSSYYSTNMYNSSANLVRDICTSYGINPLRTYWGASCTCAQSSAACQKGACIKIKGHQMYPNQTHTDPGIDWDWTRYYKLINNNPSITNYPPGCGNFYDSGGSAGNYANDERKVYVFSNSNGGQVNVNFTAFNLEANWDYLFVYNGNNINAPLIGQYTGTNSPGSVTSTNGALCFEFRSDCSTTATGWEATYSICQPPAGLSVTNITSTKARLNWSATPCATLYNVRYRVRGTTTWSSRNVSTLYLQLSNLTPATQYEWKVRSKCGLTFSAFSTPILRFTTLTALAAAEDNPDQGADKISPKTETAEQKLRFSVSPNPGKGFFNLAANNLSDGTAYIKVADQLGKTCYTQSVPVIKGEIRMQIDLTALPSDVYYLQLMNGNEIWVEKVIIW